MSKATLADLARGQALDHSLGQDSVPTELGTSSMGSSIDLGLESGDGIVIDLAGVMEIVETQGLDIKLARERFAEAQAEQRVAEAAWWPSFSVGTALYRNEGRVQGTDGTLLDVNKKNAWSGGGVSLDLDFAAAFYGTRAARHRTDQSASLLGAETQDAATIASLAYFDLVEAFERLPIAEDAQAHAQQLVSFEEARLAGGAGLQSDLARARAHEAAVNLAAIQARVQALRASSVLVDLLQLPYDTKLVPIPDGLDALELIATPLRPVAGMASAEALELALECRPELIAAHSALAASEAERSQAAHSWIVPRLVMGAQFGALGFDYTSQADQDVYTAALTWDLGSDLFGNRDRMESRRRQVEIENQRAASRVRQEVIVSAANYEAARLSVSVARVQAEAAASARELARQRHEQGAALLIERLDAQVQSLRAQVAETAALVDFNRAQIQYSRALGLIGPQIE